MITDLSHVNSADIIVISGDTEANALRMMLESFHIQTRMHFIGNVRHLIALFQNSSYLHKMTIICCHGDKEGLLIPKLSTELEKTMPFHSKLTPSNLADIIKLSGQLVINTGCCMGGRDFAQVFLNNGAGGYIGVDDYINAEAFIVFMINFVYFYQVKRRSLNEAFNKAKNIDEETKMISLRQ